MRARSGAAGLVGGDRRVLPRHGGDDRAMPREADRAGDREHGGEEGQR